MLFFKKKSPRLPSGGAGSQTATYLHIFNNLITDNCLGESFLVR